MRSVFRHSSSSNSILPFAFQRARRCCRLLKSSVCLCRRRRVAAIRIDDPKANRLLISALSRMILVVRLHVIVFGCRKQLIKRTHGLGLLRGGSGGGESSEIVLATLMRGKGCGGELGGDEVCL